MKAYVDEIGSPMGPVVFATDENGALLGLRLAGGRYRETMEGELAREGFSLPPDGIWRFVQRSAARQQLAEYFAGERRSFDLEVARKGTIFQETVWEELSRIPFGETRTYGEIARAIGWPGEAIEVGRACAANPVLLVIPCHRVVGADGSLKGYAGGVDIKESLLAFELLASEDGQKPLFN